MSPDELEVLRVWAPERDAGPLGDWLLERGAQAVEVGPGSHTRVVLTVYAEASELEPLAAALREHWGARGVEGRREPLGVDWLGAYERALSPVQLTPRVRLVPSSTPNAAPNVLHLEPGMYFGFGDHPTTALVARWLEPRAARQRVLDVGTGTGVLALLAMRAGATHALGCDVDAASVAAASVNAERNGISRCRFTAQSVAQLSERFDLVVANIEAGTLVELAPALRRCVASDGWLALSGLLREQIDWVSDAYRAVGVELELAEIDEPWALLHGMARTSR